MEKEIKNTVDEIANNLVKSLSTIKNSPLMKNSRVMPINALNGKNFKGINSTLLAHSEFDDPRFVSSKNAEKLGLDVKDNQKPITLMSWQFKDKQGNSLSEPQLIFSEFYNIKQFSNSETLAEDTKDLIKSKNEIDIDNFNDVFSPQIDLSNFNVDSASYKSDVIDAHSRDYIGRVLRNSNYPLIPELMDILSQDLSTKIHAELGVNENKTDEQKKAYFSSINSATSDIGVLSSKIDSEELISFYSAVFNTIEDNLNHITESSRSSNLSLAERNYTNTIKEYIQVEDLGDFLVFPQRLSDQSLDIVIDALPQGIDSQWHFTIENDQIQSFAQHHDSGKNEEQLKHTTITKKTAKENVLADGMESIKNSMHNIKTRHYVDLSKDNTNSFKDSIAKAKSLNARFDAENKSWYVRGKDLENFTKEWNQFVSNPKTNNEAIENDNNVYFDVSYVNRNQAKDLGATWDAAKKLWFVENTESNKTIISNLSDVFKTVSLQNLDKRKNVMESVKNNQKSENTIFPLSGQNENEEQNMVKPNYKDILLKKEFEPEQIANLHKKKTFIFTADTSEKKEAMQNGFSYDTKNDLWFSDQLTEDQSSFIKEANLTYISEELLEAINNDVETTKENYVDKIYLDVDFKSRDEAKALGAKWDADNYSWYSLSNNEKLDDLKQKFNVKDESEVQEKKNEIENNRVYLNVPKHEKDEAKALGAKWDSQKFSWYSMKDNENINALLDRWSKDTIKDIDNDHIDKPIYTATTNNDKKIFLNVDFKSRDEAKALGAKWDKANSAWFTMESNPNAKDLVEKFREVSSEEVAANLQSKQENRVYLNVPKHEKDEAKALGAKWDSQKFSWYSMKDNENLNALLDKWEIKPISNEASNELSKIDQKNNEEERLYLHVGYENKNIAKENGATYDPALTQWYWEKSKGELPEKLEQYLNPQIEEVTADPIQRFKDFLTIEHDFDFEAGELPLPDGKPHRVSLNSDTGNKQSGYYILHDNGGGMFAGIYQNFKKHDKEENWLSGKPQNNEYSESEIAEVKKKIEANAKLMKAQAKERLQIMKERVAYSIDNFLEKSETATEYTLKKEIPVYPTSYTVKDDSINESIKAFGSKGNEYNYLFQKDDLIIPLQDIKGNVVSLQNIKPNGDKYLLGGAEKRGAFHIINADMDDFNKSDIVIIAEGYATGATVEQVKNEVLEDKKDIKCVTIAAMDAHNIATVVGAIKDKYPDKGIIIAADNDFGHEFELPPKPNLGISNAEEVAKTFADVVVIFPEFKTTPDGADISKLVQEAKVQAGKEYSDFNDQATKYKNGKTLVAKEVKSGISQIVRIKNKIKDAKDDLLLEKKEEEIEQKADNKKSKGRRM